MLTPSGKQSDILGNLDLGQNASVFNTLAFQEVTFFTKIYEKSIRVSLRERHELYILLLTLLFMLFECICSVIFQLLLLYCSLFSYFILSIFYNPLISM